MDGAGRVRDHTDRARDSQRTGSVTRVTTAHQQGRTGDRLRRPERVELTVPADPAYLTVLRTACAGLAARMDLTLDEIEDLRIAVDEACALLLHTEEGTAGQAGQSATAVLISDDVLAAVFDIGEDVLAVRVSGPARRLPERSSFAWAVLEALAGEVETGSRDGRSFIAIRHRRARRAA